MSGMEPIHLALSPSEWRYAYWLSPRQFASGLSIDELFYISFDGKTTFVVGK